MEAFNKLIKNKKTLVFLDLEGTQFSHEIIAIGAVKCKIDENGKEIARFVGDGVSHLNAYDGEYAETHRVHNQHGQVVNLLGLFQKTAYLRDKDDNRYDDRHYRIDGVFKCVWRCVAKN